MKRIGLILCMLMLTVTAVFAIYVEVGTGATTTNYVPVYGLYDYSWSRTIYLQSDLVNEMEINSLSYNVGNTPNNYTFTNQTYYMRHTTSSSIQSTNYVNPAADNSFQLVYSGTVTYNDSGWHDIILDTAFEYNGTDNLEVVVHNNHGQWSSGYPNFVGTVETLGRAIYKYADGSFPQVSGTISTTYPNTRFHFTAEGEPSMAALTAPVNGSFNVQTPVELTWTNGANTDWVKVYFSENADDVLTMNPRALVANNYTQQNYTTNGLNALTNYFWRIISGNGTQYLASSAVWNFTTAAADGSILIGNGTEQNTGLPMEPYYGYSMSQTIYNQEWINIDGQRIEQISYYFNGYSTWVEDVQIYMAHTTLNTFDNSNSWVLDNELTLVYDGQIATTTQEGWITLLLDTPFNYNNTDNLLVAMEANTPGCVSNSDDFFGTSVDGNKSIYQRSDSVNSNFVSPVTGTLTNKIPNTLFTMGDMPEGPVINVTPTSLDFGDVYVNRTGMAPLAIRNLGIDNLNVNLSATGTELSFSLAEFTINPFDSIEIMVQLNPVSVGAYNRSFTVNSNDANNPAIVVATTANILPALPEGLAIIGDGTLTNQGLPFEPYYNHSYSQSIYLAGEIGLSNQQLEKISWHYNGNSAWGPDNFKIYMGMTNETYFRNSTSWISASEMVEVYDGTITVPNSDGYIEIELDTPFDYSNAQNLVVGVFHSASYHGSSDEFYCTPTDVTRSLLYYSDSTIPNHQNPPTATYMRSSYPNVKMQFIEVSDVIELTVNPSNLAYEMVLLGSNSPEKTITMKSMGLQDVVINVAPTIVGFDSNQFLITTDNNSYPLVLSFGQRATIGVTFTPNYPGAYNGELSINNNSPTQPIFRVNLRGVCETPPPDNPGNVQFAMSNNNASITWDAVTEDINHNPITPSVYAVYYNQFDGVTDNLFYFLTYTTGLSYNHIGVGRFSEFMFYRVKAYVDIDIRVLNDIDRLVKQKDKVSMEEIERLINDK